MNLRGQVGVSLQRLKMSKKQRRQASQYYPAIGIFRYLTQGQKGRVMTKFKIENETVLRLIFSLRKESKIIHYAAQISGKRWNGRD